MYGSDFEEYGTLEDAEGISIPAVNLELTELQIDELKENIDPLSPSQVDIIYQETLHYLVTC